MEIIGAMEGVGVDKIGAEEVFHLDAIGAMELHGISWNSVDMIGAEVIGSNWKY